MIGHDHLQDFRPPKVSILLPNLNSRRFLEERIQTILDQTFMDWELIIVDNYSDDGAWEYFQQCAQKDARIHISQAPRGGMYANWNNCIRLARGEYVYIATSDDTMVSDCLKKMVGALERHPDCGIAVCCFRTIDERGNEIEGSWESYGGNRALRERLKVMHTRFPPYDTIINCAWDTTWISITQLLIRRSALDKIGGFRIEFGSWGDYEWNIRSSLLTPRIHLPEFLATWRRSPGQATQDAVFSTAIWHAEAVKMIRLAYQAARGVAPNSVEGVSLQELSLPHMQEVVRATIRGCASVPQKLIKLLVLVFRFPYATLTYIAHRTIYRSGTFGLGPRQVQKLLRKANTRLQKSLFAGP
jgi:glycosyltransferase involved in cell wall biosynthesis